MDRHPLITFERSPTNNPNNPTGPERRPGFWPRRRGYRRQDRARSRYRRGTWPSPAAGPKQHSRLAARPKGCWCQPRPRPRLGSRHRLCDDGPQRPQLHEPLPLGKADAVQGAQLLRRRYARAGASVSELQSLTRSFCFKTLQRRQAAQTWPSAQTFLSSRTRPASAILLPVVRPYNHWPRAND